jgi:hypothetical protein
MLHKQKRGITCVVELKIVGEERSNQHAPITAMPNDTSDMRVSNMEPNRTSSRLQQGKRNKNGEARSAGQRERDLFADVDNDPKRPARARYAHREPIMCWFYLWCASYLLSLFVLSSPHVPLPSHFSGLAGIHSLHVEIVLIPT